MPWQIWRGSPPRGRGKVAFWDFALSFSRITPAWAGKRRAGHPVCSSSRDHPRVGGEKLIAEGIQRATPGSPPRGRGKATFPSRRPAFRRITPAWAGKRLQHTVGNPTGQDHPRVGGEKHCPHGINMTFGGSPPRGRGKDRTNGKCTCNNGITPAWAGKRCLNDLVDVDWQDHPRVGGEKARCRSAWVLSRGSPPRGRGKD